MKSLILILSLVGSAAHAQSTTASYLVRSYHVKPVKAARVASVLDRACVKYNRSLDKNARAQDQAERMFYGEVDRSGVDVQIDEICE